MTGTHSAHEPTHHIVCLHIVIEALLFRFDWMWVDHMVEALLFGSIGVYWQRHLKFNVQAFSQSFEEHGLDWYWNMANCCGVAKISPVGKKRITDFSSVNLSDDMIESIHARKESIFHDQLMSWALFQEMVS